MLKGNKTAVNWQLDLLLIIKMKILNLFQENQ